MAKKIIINLALDENNNPVFKIGPLALRRRRLRKFEWRRGLPSFTTQLSIKAFRQLLSNERAKILHLIASEQPKSIYILARLLGRDFKAVRQDVKLLEHFGFVKLKQESHGKRQRLRPQIAIEKLEVMFEL